MFIKSKFAIGITDIQTLNFLENIKCLYIDKSTNFIYIENIDLMIEMPHSELQVKIYNSYWLLF